MRLHPRLHVASPFGDSFRPPALAAILLGFLASAVALPRTAPAAARPRHETRTLSNGVLVILREDHAVPAVAVTAFVGAGSADETPGTSGSAHFLEHLLFDGTTSRTREQLAAETARRGLYSNAFTREEFTAFQLLGPAAELHAMMELQADMLFRSTLPPEEVEKERGVVLEEIAAGATSPDRAARQEFERRVFGREPATGTPDSVAGLSREAIASWYRERYVPRNVVVFVNGDVSPAAAWEGARRAYRSPAGPARSVAPARRRAWPAEDAAPIRVVLPAGSSGLAWITVPAPAPQDEDFVAAMVVARMLQEVLRSDLGETVAVGLEVSRRVPAWVIEAGADSPAALWAMTERVERHVAELPSSLGTDRVARAVARLRAEEVLQSEQPHYHALFHAEVLAARAVGSLEALASLPESVEAGDVRGVAERLAGGPRLVTLGVPADWPEAPAPMQPLPRIPPQVAESEPRVPREPDPWAGRWRRQVLPNGVVLCTEHVPGSEVIGLVVLLRDKQGHEAAACLPGAAEVLHRTFLAGSTLRTAVALEEDLAELGVELKVVDDPSLPYDDHALSPRFGYARLAAPASSATEVVRLAGEMLAAPRLDGETVARARLQADEALGRATGRGAERARRKFDEAVLAGRSWPSRGSQWGIGRVDAQALAEFARSYLAADNTIVAMASPLSHEVASRLLAREFRALSGTPTEALATTDVDPTACQRADAEPDAAPAQVWVMVGQALEVRPDQAVALRAANAYLSRRVAGVVREERGLAYSVGCEVLPSSAGGWFRVSLGTRPQNVEAAADAARAVVSGELARPFPEEAYAAAVRGEVGRLLMRRLTSAGRSFQAAVAELDGQPLDAPERLVAEMGDVPAGRAWEVARSLLRPEEWTVVTSR